MSAEFDEGGYKGLLMNRLSIDPTGLFLLDPNSSIFYKNPTPKKYNFPKVEKADNLSIFQIIGTINLTCF